MANVATCTTNYAHGHGTTRKMSSWNSKASVRKQSPAQNQDNNSRTRETRSRALHTITNNWQGQNWRRQQAHNRSDCVVGKQNRPAYMRLDSTGENSCSGSSEDSGGGCSPQFVPHFCGAPRFPQTQGCEQHLKSNPATYGHGQQQQSVNQGSGLFDRVRSVFSGHQNQGRFHQSFVRQSAPASESTLANLDLVADKFTKMSCNMMRGTPECNSPKGQRSQDYSNLFPGPPQNDVNQRSRTFAAQRYQPEGFHPYPAYCGTYQSNFTGGYRRTFNHQPWQQGMDWNRPAFGNFHRVFSSNPPPRHWQANQYRQFPWQPHWNNWTQLMQERGNWGNHYQHQRKQSPGKNYKYRTNYHHGNKKRSSHVMHSDERNNLEIGEKMKTESCEEKQSAACSVESVGLPESCQNESGVNDEISLALETSKTENSTGNVDHSAMETPSKNILADNANEQNSGECEAMQQTPVIEQPTEILSNPVVILTEPQIEDSLLCREIQRHSSIDMILSEYESKSVARVTDTMLSTDSDFSDADGESADDEHSDLWESFTTSDDPYNPLCGWRYNHADTAPHPTSSTNQSLEYMRDSHIDSGTDEGDEWSEGDGNEESEADDEDIKVDNECGVSQSPSFELSVQQLTSRPGNLSSTPKVWSEKSSPVHHPVAFILGSTSSSSEDEDDDWDTVDDSSMHHYDPLWESFNKVKDPYSPLNAWKCQSSNLSSPENSFQNLAKLGSVASEKYTPNSKRTLRECLGKPLPSENQLSAARERSPSKDSFSDSETFAILAVRVHGKRDETDGVCRGSPNITNVPGMKRVVSASCLRKVQLTPEVKATKKVRFSPSSSFIVLVERESRSSDDLCASAGTDWQACARDRMRFRDRILQAAQVLDPILQAGHREQVYQTRLSSDGNR